MEQAWTRHDGTPTPADADYLVEPTSAIGVVSSAETNRRARGFVAMERMERRHAYEVAMVALVLGWSASVWAVHGGSPLPWQVQLTTTHWIVVLGCTLGAVASAGGLCLALRARRVSYVAEAGAQLTEIGWVRSRTRVVRFVDCARFDVMRTRHHLNGSYQHTAFRYRFVDARGREVLEIRGRWNDRREPSSMLRFAVAAQRSWDRWANARQG